MPPAVEHDELGARHRRRRRAAAADVHERVLREEGELRAYGAGILSSYGEIDEFRAMEIRPIDFLEMGTIEYDITKYQPVLFCAEGGVPEIAERVGGFFAAFDDDTPDRLRAERRPLARA